MPVLYLGCRRSFDRQALHCWPNEQRIGGESGDAGQEDCEDHRRRLIAQGMSDGDPNERGQP